LAAKSENPAADAAARRCTGSTLDRLFTVTAWDRRRAARD
jgi:hypothetical protein